MIGRYINCYINYRSYYDVLPYFLKSERADLKGLENSPYHNRNGLMSVEYIRHRYDGYFLLPRNKTIF